MNQLPSPSTEEIASRWRDAVSRTVGASRAVSILYSGGLDSSLVAVSVRELAKIELVTVGVPGSRDLVAAEEGARLLAMEWVGRTIERMDVERVFASDGNLFAGTSLASRAVLVGLALALEATHHPNVLCGQGADELFLGYAHFEGLSPADVFRRREEDLDRLLSTDWPLSISLGERRDKVLGSPFLESDFLTFGRALSVDRLRAGRGRKPLLREVALALGVPEELANRPKRAFQYGSGLERLVRARSRSG